MQTLKQQLELKARAGGGQAATPTGQRANSAAPSASLVLTELAHLHCKEAGLLKGAILHGTRRLELANVARLKAILAQTCMAGGRTCETIFYSFKSMWVNMPRVITPALGGLPRVASVRVPLSVIALAGAGILHALLSQPGLVLCAQTYHGKRTHIFETVRILAKPPGAHYICAGALLARSFMVTLLTAPESLDPAANPYVHVLKVNAETSGDLRQIKRRYIGKVSELFKKHSFIRTTLERPSSSSSSSAAGSASGSSRGGDGSDAEETAAGTSAAAGPSSGRPRKAMAGGPSAQSLPGTGGVKKKAKPKKMTTLRGAR